MKIKLQIICFLHAAFVLMSVSMYSVERNSVIATINTGVTPAGIALTPDNRFAYVANNNNYSLAGADSVSVLNIKNNTVKTMIVDNSFNQPYTVTMSNDGTKAYVTNSNSTTISIIDTATNMVIGVIDGFDGPSGMVITPNGNMAYVNNYGGPEGVGSGNANSVRIVDLINNTIVGDPITVGLAPAALAITPSGKYIYVVNYVNGNPGTGTISIIKTSNNKVVDSITGFSGPFAIAITPNGKYAYVTNFGSNNFAPIGTTVSVVTLKHRSIVATIDLAIQPSGIAIASNGRFAYVTNYNTLYAGSDFTDLTAGQGVVTIIDVDKRKIVPPIIPVGQSPDAIAISSNGKHAYVSNYTSNTVSVINLS